MAIDPHGHLGPILVLFLHNNRPTKAMSFNMRKNEKPQSRTAEMYRRLTSGQYPSGIIPIGTANWKRAST